MLTFFFIIGNYTLTSFAEQNNDRSPILIRSISDDITGDGIIENIELKGILLSSESEYYQKVWAEITNEHGKKWRINYDGGYEPVLTTLKLSPNQNSLLYKSTVDKDRDVHNHKLHTVSIDSVKAIDLPHPFTTEANLKDDYTLEVKMPLEQNLTLALHEEANKLVNMGFYHSNGSVKSNNVKIKSVSNFEPYLINGMKGAGLKSYQQLMLDNDVPIATIERVWRFENNEWIVIQNNLKEP